MMKSGHQTLTRFTSSLESARHICLSCRRSIASSRHKYATTATAATPPEPSQSTSQLTPPENAVSPAIQPAYTIKAGVLLSRPPLLTPDPHPFETAYYLYQRRLNERLVLPFTQYFYYKRDTPAFERWRAARQARNGVAGRDVGIYNAYSKEAWNDEALMGDETADRETIVKRLVEEEGRGKDFAGDSGQAELAGLRRATEADKQGDLRSLERALSRTLYLLVKKKKLEGKEGGFWTFPSGTVEEKEGLKEAAERILHSSCGPNMNAWFVGYHPVGHYIYNIKNSARIAQSGVSSSLAHQKPLAGEKTFFMKSRILKGQANPMGNEMHVEDFKWLSKEEVQKEVSPQYWASVKNMLVEQ